MARQITTTVYLFEELSDTAKDRARDWFRQAGANDDFEDIYCDAAECAKLIGIEIALRPVKLIGGGTRYEPTIYFSGFSSQGDGACFEGRYAYAKGAAKAIRAHAPQDAELHRIADDLQAIQKRYAYSVEAKMRHRGHYYHSGCMDVEVFQTNDRPCGSDVDDVTSLMRDFADWIYKQLGAENDYRNSAEYIDDAMTANEYTFTESGKREG